MNAWLEGKMLLVDKPRDWTSFDIVAKIRNTTGILKVGHAGTLDPLATGLLIVCIGKYTKRITEYMGMPKTYTGTIVLGATTPTYDLESEPVAVADARHLSPEMLEKARLAFTGPLLQMPPMFSAIKKDGQPLYLAARKGETVEIEPRPVEIYRLSFTRVALPEIDFEVQCSTGTYIRSLANDIGVFLQVGGYLSALRRTHIGGFSVDDASLPGPLVQSIRAMKEQA